MPVGGTGANAPINVIFSAEGENNVLKALRDQIEATRQLRQANSQARRESRSSTAQQNRQAQATRRLDREQKRATRSANSLGRSFRTILLRTVAIIGVLRTISTISNAFRSLVRTGLEYNSAIESATLSIGALVTATSDVIDANGEILKGAEALDVAYGIAEDQVQKLRIAGIQTAATTQELVDAFQQAVGAGLQTGLTLDQIRNFTIQLTQAAGALGVPYRQLNEEIRSILGGIIDQNTRIAKSLGITNDQIKAAKEQGRLYEFLNEQFSAFNVAGERIVKTFAALKSNVQEAAELISGQIVRPLFDTLSERGQGALGGLFDFDTAQIAPELAPIIDAFQSFFDEFGDTIGDLVEGFVDSLKAGAENADELRDELSRVGESMGRIVDATVEWVKNFRETFDILGGMAAVLETVADYMQIIANNSLLFKVSLGVLAAGTIGLIVSLFSGVALAIAGAVAGGAALLGIVTAVDQKTEDLDEKYRRITRELRTQGREQDREVDRIKTIDRLTDRYASLVKELRDAREGTAEYTRLTKQLEEVENDLIANGMADVIREANGERERAVELLKEQLNLQVQNLENRLEELNLQRQQLVAERALAVQSFENRNQPVFAFRATRGGQGPLRVPDPFRPIPRDFTPEGFPQSLADIAREELIDEVDEQIKQLNDDLLLVKRLLEQTGASLQGLGNEADEAAKKIDKLTAALLALRRTSDQAKLSIETARLEQQQTLGIVGVEEYYRRRKELRDQDLENELAYQRRIIDTTTDAVERAKAEGEVIKLLAKARIEDLQDITALVLKLQEIERAGAQVRIQALRLEGELEEAKRQELIEQFRARRDQLIREGDLEGAGLIDKIIDTEVLRANLDEALLEVERFQGQISNLTGQVDLNVELGALTQRAGQLQTADIYQQLIDKFQELTKEGITLEQKLQEIVDTGTDPELVASAQKWLTVLANARGQVELLTNEWIQFEQNVRDAATDSLANYFADAVIEAENLGDALRSLGDIRSLLADLITQIIQLTTRMLALKIIESIPTFAAGGGEVVAKAQGGLIGYDGGGKVRGPGGPTADKVPALLSNGEYVIKTASVRKYGADFFSKLNAGIFPRSFRGYAEGGMVGALAQTNDLTSTDSEGLKGELQVGLSDGLVLRDMDSPAGRRFILKVIQENRRSVAQSLGAG